MNELFSASVLYLYLSLFSFPTYLIDLIRKCPLPRSLHLCLFSLLTMVAKYLLRDARPEDCESIHRMIIELATHEKLPDVVEITPEQLRQDAFGQGENCSPLFRAIVVEKIDDNQVIGYAMFYEKYSSWKGRYFWLEDIYVCPDHRRANLGLALFRRLAIEAEKLGMAMIDWSAMGWNHMAMNFYVNKIGAQDISVAQDYHLFRFHRQTYKDFLKGDYHNDEVKFD